ncbi:histone acetyltransferase type B catalytic subunit [Phymastichus coffea]|uniref:histone acetyltransferase type B catalytic subunit n=1 Tax=Phymastichus coffea TaxID=108790 RepID=UPI00273AB5DF|nr:histone acetyltransferase type B catalytic subunit [Phymastichus coffea]XP_058803110.1 histone acetyltransferase type B catalytic subunit [Phymastichus coffea]
MEDPIENRLKPYLIDSNDALEFKLVRKIHDLDDDSTTFKPEMSHQVFGESEQIFGYKDLKIKLYYSAGSLETYLGMTYGEKINKKICEDVEPDEVLKKISKFLAPKVHDNIDSFVKALSKDDTFEPAGELIYSFTIDDQGKTRNFEVYKADMSYKKFKEYHQHLQTFLLWYVDAASFIDIDDDQWHYFNMFERYKNEDDSVHYATIGFATIYQYYAYPTHTRPRISQVLILPPFQKMGLGSHLLRAIYREYINRDEVKDITVEDPSEDFQRLRDYVDCLNCSTLPSFSKEKLKKGFNKNMALEAAEKFKINKKQARRVYEILRLYATDMSDEKDYLEYRLDVKRRLNIPYKKGDNDIKKVEAVFKTIDKSKVNIPLQDRIKFLEKEYHNLEKEYKKVIKRLETASDC